MTTITFTIKAIRPPKEGSKSAMITTADDQKLWLWADKLGLVKVGATYEAIVETSARGFTNIKTVKQTGGPVVPFTPRQPAAVPAPEASAKDEQMFVIAIMKSLIEAGELKNEKTAIWNATQMLRQTWKHSFGSGPIQRQLEAAE